MVELNAHCAVSTVRQGSKSTDKFACGVTLAQQWLCNSQKAKIIQNAVTIRIRQYVNSSKID